VTASYIYTDEAGEPVAKIVRTETATGKKFQPYLATGPNTFSDTPGLDGIKLPLYRLGDVRDAIRLGETVYIVEGEGKADKLQDVLREAGSNAAVTTIAFGAKAPLLEEHLKELGGAKRVVILADSDIPGDGAATERAQAIAYAYPHCGDTNP
jgi:hypothetical protein